MLVDISIASHRIHHNHGPSVVWFHHYFFSTPPRCIAGLSAVVTKNLEFTTCIVTQQKYGIGLKIFWMMFLFLMVNHCKYSCKSLKLMGYLFKILPLWTKKNYHETLVAGQISIHKCTALNTSRIRENVSGYGLRIYPPGN